MYFPPSAPLSSNQDPSHTPAIPESPKSPLITRAPLYPPFHTSQFPASISPTSFQSLPQQLPPFFPIFAQPSFSPSSPQPPANLFHTAPSTFHSQPPSTQPTSPFASAAAHQHNSQHTSQHTPLPRSTRTKHDLRKPLLIASTDLEASVTAALQQGERHTTTSTSPSSARRHAPLPTATPSVRGRLVSRSSSVSPSVTPEDVSRTPRPCTRPWTSPMRAAAAQAAVHRHHAPITISTTPPRKRTHLYQDNLYQDNLYQDNLSLHTRPAASQRLSLSPSDSRLEHRRRAREHGNVRSAPMRAAALQLHRAPTTISTRANPPRKRMHLYNDVLDNRDVQFRTSVSPSVPWEEERCGTRERMGAAATGMRAASLQANHTPTVISTLVVPSKKRTHIDTESLVRSRVVRCMTSSSPSSTREEASDGTRGQVTAGSAAIVDGSSRGLRGRVHPGVESIQKRGSHKEFSHGVYRGLRRVTPPASERPSSLPLNDRRDEFARIGYLGARRAEGSDGAQAGTNRQSMKEVEVIDVDALSAQGDGDVAGARNNDVESLEEVIRASQGSAREVAVNTDPGEEESDNEVECVETKRGVQPLVDYPHFRHDCKIHPFTADKRRFCQKCYCFACDIPASECTKWNVHRIATNKIQFWQGVRLRVRQGRNNDTGS